jgi:hypothetical protein
VHVAVLQAKPRGRADGTGGQEPHGAAGVEPIEDAPHGIVSKGLRGSRLAQEDRSVLVCKELFEALEGTPATQRIQHEAENDRACVHGHCCGHGVIDEADQAQWVGVCFDKGQMLDGRHFDLGRDIKHGFWRSKYHIPPNLVVKPRHLPHPLALGKA